MGWLLGCFKCTGKLEGAKPKKHFSGVHHLVPGRSNLAAVAHATSPEDLRVVRKSPSFVRRKEHLEKGPSDSSTSSVREEVKGRKNAKSFASQAEERVPSSGHELGENFENFRERLLQDGNAAKHCSDEENFLSGCLSLLQSPSDTRRGTLDRSAQDSNEQVDPSKPSRQVSSLVTRIQPVGPVIETRSKSSALVPNVQERNPFKIRRANSCQSGDVDGSIESNARKRAFADGICESLLVTQNRLHQEKTSHPLPRYAPSPPWLFSTVKAQGQPFCADELADDLLMEHLDVACLIEDSALITDWELSSGSSCPDTLGSNDQFSLQVPSRKKLAVPKKLSFSEQEIKRHPESQIDGNNSDLILNHSPSVLEFCTNDEPCFDVNEAFDSEEIISNKDSKYLYCPEICAAAEESDSISSSQSCFCSQLRLLKCVLGNATENLSDTKSAMENYMLHNFGGDTNEVLLPSMRPEMEPLQEPKDREDEHHPLLRAIMKSSFSSNNERVGSLDGVDIPVNGDVAHRNISSLEAYVRSDTIEDIPKQEQGDFIVSGNLDLMSFAIEEEVEKQRKNSEVRDDSSPGGTHEVELVADDEKEPLLDAPAAAREESSSKHGTESKRIMEDSPFKLSSTALSSQLHLGTPLSVTSYRLPARLTDDRPIIGTVAAHWNPITTRKWWDGKGIPNSTNKYQEDQKVNWHAIPFEVRLEQALAKQNTVL